MAQKCPACGKFIRGGIICSKCNSQSHNECVRVPVEAKVPAGWLCGDCQIKTPKGRDPSTPVHVSQMYQDAAASGAAAGSVSSVERSEPNAGRVEREGGAGGVAGDEPMLLDDTAHNITAEFNDMELQLNMRSYKEELLAEFRRMQDSVLDEMRGLKSELRNLCSELREVRLEMADFRVSLAGVSARVDGLELRLAAVEQQRAADPEPQTGVVADLQSTVMRLQQEINDRDQDALTSDLEIGHLPEERGENVVHAVSVLAAKLGVPLEERDIVFAERVGVAQGAGAGGEAPRVRRVVVRLARRDLRDRLLQGARVRRTLTAADAGRPVDAGTPLGRIYVNERLSRVNRQLFHRVREECRWVQWKYAWTKRGRVYARQADGKPGYPIRSEADIRRIFGGDKS